MKCPIYKMLITEDFIKKYCRRCKFAEMEVKKDLLTGKKKKILKCKLLKCTLGETC